MENVADIYPLSSVQLGMLYHSLSGNQTGVYVNQYTCELTGKLEPMLLQQAWQQTIARHPVLRTAFLWDGLDEPLQVVRQEVELPWQELDWQGHGQGEQGHRLKAFLRRDRQQGFELDQAPLLRLTLIRLGSNDLDVEVYQLIWSSHHLLFDGWSLPLIWQDMLAFYQGLQQGSNIQLPAVSPYSNYIAWLQEQNAEATEAFWRSQLQGFFEPTPLPAANTNVAEAPEQIIELANQHSDIGQNYQQQSYRIGSTQVSQLQAFARQHQLTLNTVIQGAWALLLHHYSDNAQVIYGSVMSGRPAALANVEKMVGLFINTLPVCVSIDANQTLDTWLQERQKQFLDIRQYEITPLSSIQRWSDLEPGLPLFESIVVFENYPSMTPPDLGFTTSKIQHLEQSNYPLALLVVPGERIELILLYDPVRFEAGAIAYLLTYLEHLLGQFVEQPKAKLSDIPRQTAAESDASTLEPLEYPQYPRDRCIQHLIEAQVEKTPEAIAVCYGDESLTYQDLNQRANQLAQTLQAQGVIAGQYVAVCLERSLDLIVAILAVLKAGAAYIPLDPSYPQARLEYCLQDTTPQLLLTQTSVVIETGTVPRFDLDLEQNRIEINQYSADTCITTVSAASLAYIIYTSGSTGQPKGVMVSHQNLVHSTTARFHIYPKAVERFLLLSSVAFDSSVAGIFWTLCQGGELVIAPQRIEQDMQQLSALIAKKQITHTLCVPTLYRLVLEMGIQQKIASLNTVIVAGEACPRSLAQLHYQKLPDTLLYNEYGPTETTVWCAAYQIPSTLPSGSVAIGTPIPNVKFRLLNAQQKPVPPGAAGELYIGGEGVTQGYWNQPEQTEKAFQNVGDWGRLYRTGDLARCRADGHFEWLGRCDRQVKIRGYRIELGEIEDALQAHPKIQETVVVSSKLIVPSDSQQRLMAYVVPCVESNTEVAKATVNLLNGIELRQFLQSRLPDYMIPTQWIELASLPRNANGKIDARALPLPEDAQVMASTTLTTQGQAPPRTENEEILADIWCEVLGLETLGIHDHFFELGGDSILSIQIVSMAREAGLSLLPNQLFEHPTIASLAATVTLVDEGMPEAEQSAIVGRAPLTPIQHWFFEQEMVAPHHWHQARLFELPASTTVERVKEAIATLWEHHDALRLCFERDESAPSPWQQIHHSPDLLLPLQQVDLSEQGDAEQCRAVALHATPLRRSLNLTQGPLMQATYFKRNSKQPNWLLLDLHHLVVDGVSWQILQQDLETLLSNSPVLTAKTTAFKTWAEQSLVQAHIRQAELDFWLQQLEQPALQLPRNDSALASQADVGRGPQPVSGPWVAETFTEAMAQTITIVLDTEQTHQLLQTVPATYNTQINDALLTALAHALQQTVSLAIGQTDEQIIDRTNSTVRLDLESYGREGLDPSLDLSRTVGWFTTVYPVQLQIEGEPGVSLKSIKEQLRRIPNHGIGYGLLRYLTDESSQQRLKAVESPEILFNYLGQRDRQISTIQGSNSTLKALTHVDLGPLRDPRNTRRYLLEINAWVMAGQLEVNWTYNDRVLSSSMVEQLANSYIQALKQIIDHCTTSEAGGFTPSDFPDANLEQSELDDFIAQLTQS